MARLEVNLDELFGTLTPNSTEFRQSVGQAIIDKIRDRTANGINKDGKRFKDYSTEYSNSIEFAAYGKSKGQPNLKQTGDMLGFLDIIDEEKNKIVIGWTDENEAGKAHGHITGSVGVTRDFLGLPDSELKVIVADFMPDLRDAVADIDASTTRPSVPDTDAFISQGTAKTRTTIKDIFNSVFGDDSD